MSKTRMMYFEKDDVLHLAISDEPEAGSVELSPNITVELNDKGEMWSLEPTFERFCRTVPQPPYVAFRN